LAYPSQAFNSSLYFDFAAVAAFSLSRGDYSSSIDNESVESNFPTHKMEA
jgi:hypothetical protein